MDLQTSLTTAAATSSGIACRAGRQLLYAAGTWGSGTLTLTWSPTLAGTYAAIGTGVSLTADGTTGFEVPEGWIKAALANSTDADVAWGFDGTSGRAAAD
jgi:hypothetical protein